MFRIISLAGFLMVCAGIVFIFRKKETPVVTPVLRGIWNHLVTSFRHLKQLSVREVFKVIVVPLTVLSILVLALTGFIPVIIFGRAISGYLLMLHVSIAPVFAICMALTSLIWAHQNSFTPNDWEQIQRFARRTNRKKRSGTQGPAFWQKLCFWGLVTLSMPIILSILLSMYPIFGTHGQEVLLQLHRYTTLMFVLIFVLYSALSLRGLQAAKN